MEGIKVIKVQHEGVGGWEGIRPETTVLKR